MPRCPRPSPCPSFLLVACAPSSIYPTRNRSNRSRLATTHGSCLRFERRVSICERICSWHEWLDVCSASSVHGTWRCRMPEANDREKRSRPSDVTGRSRRARIVLWNGLLAYSPAAGLLCPLVYARAQIRPHRPPQRRRKRQRQVLDSARWMYHFPKC